MTGECIPTAFCGVAEAPVGGRGRVAPVRSASEGEFTSGATPACHAPQPARHAYYLATRMLTSARVHHYTTRAGVCASVRAGVRTCACMRGGCQLSGAGRTSVEFYLSAQTLHKYLPELHGRSPRSSSVDRTPAPRASGSGGKALVRVHQDSHAAAALRTRGCFAARAATARCCAQPAGTGAVCLPS